MTTDPQKAAALVEPALGEAAALIARNLEALLPRAEGPEAPLIAAMRKAVLEKTDRLRGFLVLQSGRLFGVDGRALARVAVAVECLHASALAHDDLPALGGGGQGSAQHGEFGAAASILAGDGLTIFAFGLLAAPDAHGDPFVRCELVARLSEVAGHGGLLGGQMMNVVLADTPPVLHEITRLQRMKTAGLVAYCCEAGAILGKASQSTRAALCAFGQELGATLQIAKDLQLHDAQADTAAPNIALQNAKRGKLGLVSVLGAERAHAQGRAMAEQAARHLDLFDEKADLLRAVCAFAATRPV